MSDHPDRDQPLAPEPPPWDAFEEPERPSNGRRLLLLAALPWIVVAVVVARTIGTSDATPRVAAPSPTTTSPAVSPSPSPGDRAVTTEAPGPVALRFGPRVAPGPSDAAAVGVVVARNWLGGIGPEPAVEVGAAEGSPVYVEHLAVEAVDLPTSDTAVVTIVAVVMDVEGDAYTDARVVRLGVPVSLGPRGAHPAGDPWWLPAPDLTARRPTWTPVDDPDALARAGAALESAGYRDVSVLELATSPSWPMQVTAKGTAPGGSTSGEHVVWLRDHLGELVVAGALPRDQEGRP